MLKQMIIISDGQSNIGPSPEEMAALALENFIVVNTIGIIDKREEAHILEMENIAERGGGICELTDIRGLADTLSRVTVKSIYSTVEEMVSEEIKEILDVSIEDINPQERYKFVRLVDKIGDEIDLRCLILLDISGSMEKKIEIAKQSIFELLFFLEERTGESNIGVMVFPAKDSYCKLLCDFTQDLNILKESIKSIKTGGTTPTGFAIEEAIKVFEEDREFPAYKNIV